MTFRISAPAGQRSFDPIVSGRLLRGLGVLAASHDAIALGDRSGAAQRTPEPVSAQSLEAERNTLRSLRDVLTSMRHAAGRAHDTRVSESDRTSAKDELVALKRQLDSIALTDRHGQPLLPALTSSRRPSVDRDSPLRVGAEFAGRTVADVQLTGVEAGGVYTLRAVASAAGALDLRNDLTGASQIVTISQGANTGADTVLDFGQLGVRVTLKGPTATPHALVAALAGATLRVASTADAPLDLSFEGSPGRLDQHVERALASVESRLAAVEQGLSRVKLALASLPKEDGIRARVVAQNALSVAPRLSQAHALVSRAVVARLLGR